MKRAKTKRILLLGTMVLIGLLTVVVILMRPPNDVRFAVRYGAKLGTRVAPEPEEQIGSNDSPSASSIQESPELTPAQAGDGTNRPPSTLEQTDPGSASGGRTGEFVHLAPATNPGVTPLELVWIPPGTFVLGSSPHETSRGRNEGPETSVTISYGFWLGKYEVTIGQYQDTARPLMRMRVGVNVARTRLEGTIDQSEDQYNDLPVINVNWLEAMNFCRLLTQREREAGTLPQDYAYRLPTEAEWEYACRAGTNTRFSFGDDPNYSEIAAYAWFEANSEGWIHPVGGKLPNPWGLYDMHGNVGEWCLDWLGDYPGGAVTNPLGTIPGRLFAFRGGTFHFPARSCRSASRARPTAPPDNSEFGPGRGAPSVGVGFRVALAPNLPSNAPE